MLKRLFQCFVSILFLSLTIENPLFSANQEISFNPRAEYVFGVGTAVGGPLGVVGLISEFNWDSLINTEIGLGSGIHFDSYIAQARYLILDRAFTPYVGAGLAYWKSTSPGPKMAEKSQIAVDLGIVKEDGTDLKNAILIFPMSIGLHYISDLGLAIFTEVELLFSLSNLKGRPYGALGVQWYF